jgi:hypothetical protein
MTITVGSPVTASRVAGLGACVATFVATYQDLDPKAAIAQPVRAAVTITSAAPGNAAVEFGDPWFLQADGPALPRLGLGLWVRDDPDAGPTCGDPRSPTVEAFDSVEFRQATLGKTPSGSLWFVMWPTAHVTFNGVDRDALSRYAALRPSVTLNGVTAAISYRPSPSVLWCGGQPGDAASPAIVVDPKAAGSRGCTPIT